MPESYDDSQNAMASKDKRMKALHARYQDVPNVESDAKAWESKQGARNKGQYKTIDEI